MKKLLCFLFSVVMFTGCLGTAVQAEEEVYIPVIHTYTVTEDSAGDEFTAIQRGTYLLSGSSHITREDSSHINICGATNATKTSCDEVKLVLFVERSKSYSTGYSTYKTYPYTENDVYCVTREVVNIPVEKGYYYRVHGVHSVMHNGVRETTETTTDPLSF